MTKNTGAGMPRADMSVLLGMSIPLPPLVEQRKIVMFLERAADIRRRAGDARAKVRAIVPALFVDVFGDPASNCNTWDLAEIGDLVERIDSGWSPACDEGVPGQDGWGVL